jgi:hypothetical protein
MAVNFDILLQDPIFEFYAIPCTIIPRVSQPNAPNYAARGILNTVAIDVQADDESIYSDQRTIFDIRESEFPIMPQQDDHVIIPFDCNNAPKGEYQILDLDSNGGGQTQLTIRKVETAM